MAHSAGVPADQRARSASVMRAISRAAMSASSSPNRATNSVSQSWCRLFSAIPARTRDLAVSALVVIVARVQRLVHIADEMQQELQRETPLPLARAGIARARR